MPEERQADPLALLAALPAGRVTVLPPATRPPPPDGWSWQPHPAVLQIVLAGELPHRDAGGGIVGPRVLRPGDLLVALTGSWSRRHYASERRLLSLACTPGLPWLELYLFRPPRRDAAPQRFPLRCPPALLLAAEALATCRDAGAAADLGRAILGLLRREAAVDAPDADAGLGRAARAWLAERALGACSRRACAAALGVHPDHLTRCLRRQGGSWSRELLALRLRAARARLLAGEEVGATARACGWASPSHFVAVFRRAHGTTPQRWRARQDAT